MSKKSIEESIKDECKLIVNSFDEETLNEAYRQWLTGDNKETLIYSNVLKVKNKINTSFGINTVIIDDCIGPIVQAIIARVRKD